MIFEHLHENDSITWLMLMNPFNSRLDCGDNNLWRISLNYLQIPPALPSPPSPPKNNLSKHGKFILGSLPFWRKFSLIAQKWLCMPCYVSQHSVMLSASCILNLVEVGRNSIFENSFLFWGLFSLKITACDKSNHDLWVILF